MATLYKKLKKVAIGIAAIATLLIGFPGAVSAARTDALWDYPNGTSYIKPNGSPFGNDLLIFGSNHYLNFGTLSGTSGYGIRDNGGVIECKNSGGAWAACVGGASSITGLIAAGTNVTLTGTGTGGDPYVVNSSGGSGSPAGSSGQLQYNAAGSFAGVSTSTVTVSTGLSSSVGSTFAVVGGSNTTLTATLGTNVTPNELNNAASANSLIYTDSAGTLFKSVASSSLAVGSTLSSSGTLGGLVGGSASTLDINLTNQNTWTGLQQFNGNASTTALTDSGLLWLTALGTPAGTFLAADPNGKVIATTTPGGSFTNTLANGGTATTTFYNKGVVFSDGSKLTQASGSGASILNWDNTNGRLGIGTSSPMDTLSVAGNIQAYGTFHHFGSATALAPCNTTMGSSNCVEIVGNDNTVGGVGEYISNINAGASAYSGLTLMNTLVGNATTNYAGLFLNGANYNDNTFGSANNLPNLIQLGNSMGAVSIQSFAPTAAASFVNIVVASTTPGAGPSTNSEVARFTSTGKVGIGTSSPTAKLHVTSTSTDPTMNLFVLANNGTPVLTVATGTTALNIATSSAIGSNVLTVNGGVYFHGLAAGAGNGTLCATTDGLVSYDAGANCIVSSLRFKNVDATITPEESIATVLKLSPIFFHYKQGYGDNGKAQQEGFGAEDVALVDTDLVQYDASGTPFSVYYQNITAKLVGAVQAIWNRLNSQQAEIDQLKAQVKALQDAQQRPAPKPL